ncbi:flavodoxin [Caniella muris]|uniref:flavodoxin n=1 Tax=Caniella muris TaxID=2941502 RepID=UPI00203B5609|nr:flavodoxin [Caniella muris]
MDATPTLTRRDFVAGTLFSAATLALAGCSQAPADQPSSDQGASGQNTSGQGAPGGQASTAGDGTVLVAYFSGSGNTARVAENIADDLGCTTFQVLPTEPYTTEDLTWTDPDSRVNHEHDNESARDIPLEQVTPDNWDSYDTVFVGYPIWWGIAAWPIDGFVAGNDFSGKTVYPFCTSTSSPVGDSAAQLAQLAGTGDWKEGMRFSGGASEQDVRTWVDGLGL